MKLLLLALVSVLVAGCSVIGSESPEAASDERPFGVFPDPSELGSGWEFTNGEPPAVSSFDISGTVSETTVPSEDESLSLEELASTNCDNPDTLIGSSELDELSADYTAPSGDRVWVRVFLGNDEARSYHLATFDFLARCARESYVALPNPSIAQATNTRRFEVELIPGVDPAPVVFAEVGDKVIELWHFADEPSPEVDLVAVAELVAAGVS